MRIKAGNIKSRVSDRVATPLPICVVTQDLLGWSEFSESAASMEAFAQDLALSGEQVTILWVPGEVIPEEKVNELKSNYLEKYLITLEILQFSREMPPGLNSPEKRSAAVYFHLRLCKFSVVYFSLEGGLAYYTFLARETGVLLFSTRLVVVVHSPIVWCGEVDKYYLKDLKQIGTAYMEIYCIKMSDRLICVSEHMHGWIRKKEWELPSLVDVLPALAPKQWRFQAGDDGAVKYNKDIREIVLFAGPMFRDGINLFCDSIDNLVLFGTALEYITVFGPFGKILGEHTGGLILRRARRWPVNIRLFPGIGFNEQLKFARDRAALAVIPSTANATGKWVAGCLDLGIAFVATGVGANLGLVQQHAHEYCFAEPNSAAIAKKISIQLAGPLIAKARLSAEEKREAWLLVNVQETVAAARPVKSARRAHAAPLVSVVMVHHDRPQFLLQAVASIERQSYANIELVLVDDGSKLPESHSTLDRLEIIFGKRGWKILRLENQYLGAARNAGVKASRGDRILFVDDDNALFPEAVAKFVRAIEVSGADICTAFHRTFYEQFVPSTEQLGTVHYIALGGSLDLGFVQDSFGDANAMFRRSVFNKIGYLIEDYGYTAHDWEIFARAALAGLKLRIIPEPLYWYRSSARGMYRNSHWYDSRLPILAAYREKKFKGLEYIYHLVLAAHTSDYESESYRHNLYFSPSDQKFAKLCNMDPNSEKAFTLLAEIAASEGRPDTALMLIARIKSPSFLRQAQGSLGIMPQTDLAVRANGAGFIVERGFSVQELLEFETGSTRTDVNQPTAYVEGTDRFYLQAYDQSVSIAVLPAGCPAGTVSVSLNVSLDQAISEPAEFIVLLCAMYADPILSVQSSSLIASEASSGWHRITDLHTQTWIGATLSIPSPLPLNLVLAVRPAKHKSDSVLGCFSSIKLQLATNNRSARRPRIGPPPSMQRAREWTEEERQRAYLLTKYRSELPLLLLPPEGQGVFLRPSKAGPVVAIIDAGFPPLARGLIGKVEIAHEEASPFEFALALTLPSEAPEWRMAGPKNCLAFSGWTTVNDKFKLHDINLTIRELVKLPLSVNLAIRLPKGSSPSPANAFWRKIIFAWDE